MYLVVQNCVPLAEFEDIDSLLNFVAVLSNFVVYEKNNLDYYDEITLQEIEKRREDD
jgi:hypothetical protein